MRSFVYYDMGLLMGAAQDYHAATKATDKARSNLKKKQDAASKPGERGTKAGALVYAPSLLRPPRPPLSACSAVHRRRLPPVSASCPQTGLCRMPALDRGKGRVRRVDMPNHRRRAHALAHQPPTTRPSSPEAKGDLNKCKMVEARERDRFTKLKHAVMKNSMLQVSSNYLQMFSKGAHLFNGVYDVVELMPEDPPENPTSFDAMGEMMTKSNEAVQNIPDSVECRCVGCNLACSFARLDL
jgi:hypothetical protein